MAGVVRRIAALLDRRRGLIVAAMAGWVLVIASGAGAAPSATSWLGVPDLRDVLVIVFGIYSVIGLLLFVVMLITSKVSGQTVDLPARKPLWPALILLALLIVILSRFAPAQEADSVPETPTAEATPEETASRREPVIGGGELAIVLVVATAAGAIIVWSRRRLDLDADGPGFEESVGPDLEPVIESATRRLELGSDPRSAVIAAFAELEDALAAAGSVRARSETSTELVARALGRYAVDPEPFVDLASIYEVARFSDHPITEANRAAAAAALRRARRGLPSDEAVS